MFRAPWQEVLEEDKWKISGIILWNFAKLFSKPSSISNTSWAKIGRLIIQTWAQEKKKENVVFSSSEFCQIVFKAFKYVCLYSKSMLSKKGETDNADMSTNEAWPPTPSAAPGKVEKNGEVEIL